jgi:hypothetical protein
MLPPLQLKENSYDSVLAQQPHTRKLFTFVTMHGRDGKWSRPTLLSL